MSAPSAAAQAVRVEEREDVAYVTLDRPPVNVLNIAAMRELTETLRSLARKQALRAIVLRGEGKAFSAGVDIGEHQGETLRPLLDTFHHLILEVLASPIPVISRVHGVALGGACELVLASDIAIVAEESKIGCPEIKLGVIPPAAAVLFPPRIGTNRALELILTGQSISGAEAARIGLVNRAVPADRLDEELEALLNPLRSVSAFSIRVARRAVVESLDKDYTTALTDLERLQADELIPSHDAQEGLRAYLEKRPPNWQHR